MKYNIFGQNFGNINVSSNGLKFIIAIYILEYRLPFLKYKKKNIQSFNTLVPNHYNTVAKNIILSSFK